MKRILYLILILLLAVCPVYSQGYIDASGWLSNDYESIYPDHISYVVFSLNPSSTGWYAYYFFHRGGLFPFDNDPVILEMIAPPSEHAGSVMIDSDGVSTFVFPDGRAVLMIERGDRTYRTNVSLLTSMSGSDYQLYVLPRVAPTAESFVKLDLIEGPIIGGSPDLDGSCCESLIALLQWLGELQQHNNTLLQWYPVLQERMELLQREQSILLQYIVGFLSFLSGMILAMVFLFGLKLR